MNIGDEYICINLDNPSVYGKQVRIVTPPQYVVANNDLKYAIVQTNDGHRFYANVKDIQPSIKAKFDML